MPTLDELAADLAQFKQFVPTTEELLASTTIVAWASGTSGSTPNTAINGSTRFTLAAFNKPVRITGLAISFEYWGLAASDTSYWSCTMEKGNEGDGFPDIATRSTQATGAFHNGPIVRRTPWTFDAAAFTNPDIAAGELLTVNWWPFGSPPALVMPATYTFWYQPL